MLGGGVQESLDQLVDIVIQGGREQQALTGTRGRGEQPRYDGQESEICHVVGLVQNADLNAVQSQVALLE